MKPTTIDDIEWEKVNKKVEKLSIAKRKTAIQFSHRWLSSGSKNFAEPMICSHCKQRDSPETDHDHFLTCEFSNPYQTKRINEFSILLVSMKTPQELLSLLTKGLSLFYNNTNNRKISSPLSELLTKHSLIGWNQLSRGRISKGFTQYMTLHYTSNKTKLFSGEEWSKRVIEFLLNTYIEAWISHCNEIHTSSSKAIKSLAHQSLLITIESLFDKDKSLPQQLQKWFSTDTNEITELSLQRLKIWTCNTKQLIKINKPHITDNRKMTEFFIPFNVNNITTPPITNSVCHSTIEKETSASTNNHEDIIITKSDQHNKSTIRNIKNKKNKENVIEKGLKEIDQKNPFLNNITDQITIPSSSLTTHQDCKVASLAGRSPPIKVSRHIQPTFEITVPFILTNNNIRYDAYNPGSPTKRDRPNSEMVLEKVTINKNLINERSDENEETNCDENNIKMISRTILNIKILLALIPM